MPSSSSSPQKKSTAESAQLRELTEEEVAQHNTETDCWLIIGEPGERFVYDVTKYLDDHPGGPEIILDLAGQNATDEFEDIGHSNDARAKMKEFLVGKLKEDVAKPAKTNTSSSNSGASNGDKSAFVSPLLILVAIVVVLLGFFLHLKSSRNA